MPAATRVGDSDSGICNLGLPCCPHNRTGENSAGSPNVFINGKSAHRLGDSGDCNCPHSGVYSSSSGSSSVFINGKPATRIGDETTCTACGEKGSHIAGSPDVFIGG